MPGPKFSTLIEGGSFATYGEGTDKSNCKIIYKEMEPGAYALFSKHIQDSDEIQEIFFENGISWPDNESDVLAGKCFFDSLTDEQGTAIAKIFE